jgi:hypothetical protein
VDANERARRRTTTVFGWLAGGCLGLLVNYGVFALVGEAYPIGITTFACFVAGAFGGMWVSDRLGLRGFRPLGVVAGILLTATITLVLAIGVSRLAGR